jgi:hypothetical protein
MTCRETREVLKEFDRDTRRLFVGLLGILFLAAWVCVTFFQERQPRKTDSAGITSQVKSESSPTAAAATRADLSANVSSGAVLSKGSAEGSIKGDLARSEPAEESTPSSLAVLSPETAPTPTALANKSERSVASLPDVVRKIRGEAAFQSYRPFGQLGDAEVKKRLLELWHHSLASSEKTKNWAMFSKLDKKKKAVNTAARRGSLKAHPNFRE